MPVIHAHTMSSQTGISKMHSLLIDAVHIGDATIVGELLQGGTDPDGWFHKDDGEISRQNLPLHEATGCEDAEMVRLLVVHGVDVFKTTSTGATALHDAALCGNYAAAKLLLEHGVKVDVQDNAGRTALHEAAEHGQEVVIRLLLEWHASAIVRANDGRTPADLAIDHGHFRAFQLLLEYGGHFDKRRGYTKAWNQAVWTRNCALAGLLNINKAAFQNIQARAKPLETLISWIERSIIASQRTEPQVCSKCVGFHSRPPSIWERGYAKEVPGVEDAYYYHLVLDEVKASAKQGCVFCRMILDSLRNPGTGDKEIEGNGRIKGDSRAERDSTKDDETSYGGNMVPRGRVLPDSSWVQVPEASKHSPGPRRSDYHFDFLDRSEVRLTYKAYSKRYLRAPTRCLWSDFLDKIEVRCGNRLGYIRVAPLDDDIARLLSHVESLDDCNTGSASALAVVGLWLKTCLTHHVKCNQYQEAFQRLPPRVIDVGPPDGSQEPFLYSSKEQRGLYLTLSHRWGDYDAVKTRQDNLSERSSCIPWHSLPDVFRDAVHITRKLGVRFLWIDTLCIVQDDPSDWEFQASKMADIFRNSLMTIAAAADDCQKHGIFRRRTSERKRPCAIDLRLSHRQTALFQRPGRLFAFADRHEMAIAERPLGVLDTRAWIFQEQVLSPRILYFTQDELFWHCNCLNASESYPTGIPILVYEHHGHSPAHGQSYTLFKRAVTCEKMKKGSVSKTEIYKIWRQIVHTYSNRNISVETDRIIAMAGIVNLMEKMLNDKCIFGLWENHLNSEEMWQELLWSVDMKGRHLSHTRGEHHVVLTRRSRKAPVLEDQLPDLQGKTPWMVRRPMELRAPTWSWFSVMAPITFKEVDSHDHNSVMCEAQLQMVEKFQELTTLVLRGRMTKMYPRSGYKISPIPYSELGKRTRPLQYYANLGRTGLQSSIDLTADWQPDISNVHAWTDELYCFEIARQNTIQLCLCLFPLKDSARPKGLTHLPLFERVGICGWNMEINGELPYNPVQIYIV